ncbi:hypothetical protein GSI_02730 [Ganoderma sinense ZZ0214-1]|uniref:F-box domain-containing protein n=1 Tax=Ganoderma sinense ZZ0214-1 TaxID=1077348 RepID=A0A2G8SMI6_9APHY|nr:hypothetical protein GSI_02730 [Ganoderma sinense ZZ0214-1]
MDGGAHNICNLKVSSTEMHSELPADILFLIFSLLGGDDITRCMRVCLRFTDLIRSDLYLQYKIDLAQNSMVDGSLSTLPISERQKRLREYSSRFRDGTFDHEDLSAHPHYSHQVCDGLPGWNMRVVAHHSLSTLYSENSRYDVTLSLFTPGSLQAGVQSSRYLLPIGAAGGEGLIIAQWAIDGAQDLLVIAETADMDVPEDSRRRPDEVHFRFYSVEESSTGVCPTPHPAAKFPALQFVAPALPGIDDDVPPTVKIVELHIAGPYVIWEVAVIRGEFRSVFVEACNWRTGDVISRINVGTLLVNIIPLDYPYLLVIPKALEAHPQSLAIYNFSRAPAHESDIEPSERRVCTLQLPAETLEPEERIRSHRIYTGDRPQTREGHFLPDPSHSVVVLTFFIACPHPEDPRDAERETHLLIPRATLLAHIRAAESESRQSKIQKNNSDATAVPWAEWGPHADGCLRLRGQRRAPWSLTRGLVCVPCGSRFPLVAFDDPDDECKIASVCVFDVNPLAARRRRQMLARREDGTDDVRSGEGSTAIVDDIEEMLPGVVDADCSRIPWVAYRFRLPYNPEEWPYGHVMDSVVMTMTGFAIQFGWVPEWNRRSQTWTV